MGFDIHLGPLSQYYTDRKGRAVESAFGIPVTIVPDGRTGALELVKVRHAVEDWEAALPQVLGIPRHAALPWDESPSGAERFERVDWEEYWALMLLAAYDEHPELSRPDEPPEEPYEDPAVIASQAKGFDSRYEHILRPVLWLPWDFPRVVTAKDPLGEDRVIGSSPRLLKQLEAVNARTLQLNPEELKRRETLRGMTDLEILAVAMLALFLEYAMSSVRDRLPLILDF